MKNTTVRCSISVVSAWIALAAVVFSCTAWAVPHPGPSVTIAAYYYGVGLAIPAPASFRSDSWDGEFIHDDPDRLVKPASALVGMDRPQSIAMLSSSTRPCQTVFTYGRTLYFTFIVEPRFLRYCRLLN
ncbi:MAG: hypothetical protein ACYC9J_08045 [Sulfuricaulis sp.]